MIAQGQGDVLYIGANMDKIVLLRKEIRLLEAARLQASSDEQKFYNTMISTKRVELIKLLLDVACTQIIKLRSK